MAGPTQRLRGEARALAGWGHPDAFGPIRSALFGLIQFGLLGPYGNCFPIDQMEGKNLLFIFLFNAYFTNAKQAQQRRMLWKECPLAGIKGNSNGINTALKKGAFR